MPTVLRAEGFRFFFWSREPNEPPHIHVDKAGASAKVWLEPVALAGNAGYPARDLGVVLGLVRENRSELIEAWHEFFGAG
ncbi:MAG: DUF4160 domain-containing protein [Acetobacteraceae bacterium]